MSEKVTGYILLGLGIAIMAVSAWQVYQVFTGAQLPLSITQSSGVMVNISPELPPTELISGKEIDQLTNLTLHYLLMTFLVSLGFKISTLGTQLLRTIEVKVSAKQP